MNKITHKIFLLLIAISVSGQLFAQEKSCEVKALILDTLSKPLPYTTAVLLDAKDSVLYKYTISDNGGNVYFNGVKPGDYIFQLSYMGYNNFSSKINVSAESKLTDLGSIELNSSDLNIDEVTVSESRIPIVFKKDTIEYNANAFKTQVGDVVEDLLRKLPGIQIDKDGNIKAQGKEVKKVFVDGKEFFGDDPKIAVKNLSSDAIDKVQVYDKMSDMSEFTGIDDGSRSKVINLNLKKNKKKGIFGNIDGGYGNQDRFKGKFNLNKFSKNTQISALGTANNTNEQAFSFSDYFNFMGGISNFMSGNTMQISSDDIGMPMNVNPDDGFTTTLSGGLNINHDFKKKTSLYCNYFYNRINKDLESEKSRLNYFNNETYNSYENENFDNLNENHRIDLKFKRKFGTDQDLQLKFNMRYKRANSSRYSDLTNFNTDATFQNNSITNYSDKNNAKQITSSILYRKKFKKKGRSLVSEITYGLEDNYKSAFLNSLNEFMIDQALNLRQDSIVRQNQYKTNDKQYIGGQIAFTEPIGKSKYLKLSYSHYNYYNNLNKEFIDIAENGSLTEVINPALSNKFDNKYVYDNSKLTFYYLKKKFKFNAEVGAQYSQLFGENITLNNDINKTYLNILPRLTFRYSFTPFKSISFRYNTFSREPNPDQLQPVTDNSDPLNVYIGNPELKAEYVHTADLSFMSFNQFNFTNLFLRINGSYTQNKITNSIEIDSMYVQNTTPVNVKGDLSLNGNLTFETPLKFIKTNINLGINSIYNNGILFINGTENGTNRYTNTIDFYLDKYKDQYVDFIVGTKLTHNYTTYSESSDFSKSFLTQNYYAQMTFNFLKRWTFHTKFNYRIYSGEAFEDKIEQPVWKAYLAVKLFKLNKGQLRLSVTDILNENKGFARTSNSLYLEESRVNTLGRYFLVSFRYNISSFGNKDVISVK